MTLLTYLDEHKLLHCLPRYVSDGHDNMPSTRLNKGDLKILMSYLAKMDDRLIAIVNFDLRSEGRACTSAEVCSLVNCFGHMAINTKTTCQQQLCAQSTATTAARRSRRDLWKFNCITSVNTPNNNNRHVV
jgi:hypothetical protein